MGFVNLKYHNEKKHVFIIYQIIYETREYYV